MKRVLESQYVSELALRDKVGFAKALGKTLNVLHAISDPCLKYQVETKMWINLHHGLSQGDFGNLKIITNIH